MPTNRNLINRRRKDGGGVTDHAIKLFETMLHARSGCTCPGPAVDCEDCAQCQRYHVLGGELHTELGLKPWQWPVVREPDGEPTDDAERRHVELETALLERKKGLLRAYLEAHPDKRRDPDKWVYQQVGPARFRPVIRKADMTAETGWLTTADL
jgi:hypothetical protein